MSTEALRLPRLWLARTDREAPPWCADWLDPTEQDRLAGLTRPVERRRRAIAWGLRRWALSRACPAVSEAEWRFAAGPYGKPELTAAFATLDLHHSLSHGGAYAAVLVAGAPCGVDVEAPPDGLEGSTVAFGPREQAEIATHARPRERFLQHWVAKEAVLKLAGIGLGGSPERLSLDLAEDGRSAEVRHWAADTVAGPRPVVRLWPLQDGHWLAAAAEGEAVADLPPLVAPFP